MTLNQFSGPPDRRFFEDYKVGHMYEFGTILVSRPEIIEFARRYDPQYFHLDPARAAASEFGGIIASGFHTTSLAMRLYVDHYLSHVASLASPGVDEIRWPNPLRPGDLVRIRVTILEARLSRSKPDRGIVRARVEAVQRVRRSKQGGEFRLRHRTWWASATITTTLTTKAHNGARGAWGRPVHEDSHSFVSDAPLDDLQRFSHHTFTLAVQPPIIFDTISAPDVS